MYDRAILIIRNPLDAFIASVNLGATSSHVEHGSYEQWMKIDMQKLDNFFLYWKKFHEEILDHYIIPIDGRLNGAMYNDIHIVEYSELKSDLIGQITKIVNFLGLPMTNYIEECILKNQDGFHKRLKKFLWKDYLIKIGKIDQDVIQLSKKTYNEFVQKLNKNIYDLQ